MLRQSITKKPLIVLFLIIQLIPLVLFPLSSFQPNSQEWWLPVVLAILILTADFEILFQKNDIAWPWYLLAFAQGFNIISRLMMLFPHATLNNKGTIVFNSPYVIITLISMACSIFIIWYTELPEVRITMLRD